MKNSIHHSIKKVKEFFGQLSQEEIFDIARQSTQEFTNQKNKYLKFDSKKSIRYLGKIFKALRKREDGIYNDEFILFSLGYLFKHTSPGEQVVLENCTCLSEVANGEEDVKDSLTFQETKKYIIQIAKKYFPERVGDLLILNMEEQEDNKELFSQLRTSGIESLGDGRTQPQIPENFNSLDLARYLYRASMQNSNLLAWIESLQPPTVLKNSTIEKTESNFPQYYGLIEIACRLNDFLKGKSIQGGIERQSKYDNLIMTILGLKGDIKKFPQLRELQQFCDSRMKDQGFDRVYIYNDRYETLLKQRSKKIEKRNTIAKRVGWTSAALLGTLGLVESGYQTVQEKKQQDFRLAEQHIIHDIFQDKQAGQTKEAVAKTIDALEMGASFVNDIFVKHYRANGEDILPYIKNELRKEDNLQLLFNQRQGINAQSAQDFISQVLIPNCAVVFVDKGIDVLPYQQYTEHQEAFTNTLQLQGDLEFGRNALSNNNSVIVRNDDHEEILKDNGLQGKSFDLNFSEKFTAKDGKEYMIGIVYAHEYIDVARSKALSNPHERPFIKHYIAAYILDEHDQQRFNRRVYTTKEGREIVKEIIEGREIQQKLINDK